ncbi:unnamed protein product [Caenorhabditis auriculariae]|uniref:DUF19 domain-containing protein n=1 Tax=Caenorhabditis auriculariae TaxID=2777116 RepID=A0A8S1GNY9_9PELO|nr:unnamed protein product [Caenorhabditis auriculariae]
MLPSLFLFSFLFCTCCGQNNFNPLQYHPQIHSYVQYLPDVKSKESLIKVAEVCGANEQAKVKECADPLYKMGAISEDTNTLGWEGFLYRTKAYFSDPHNFFLFDVCIEPYKDVCFTADSTRFKYDAALKMLDFLCRDGYSEMVQNLECFTRTLTRAEMMQCQAELVADTRKISETGPSSLTPQNTAVCGAMRNYVDCVKYPIRYECGYRAWQLVRELIVRPTKTLLPTCKLNFSHLTNFSTVFLITIAFLFFHYNHFN